VQIRKTSEYILAYVLWVVSCAFGAFIGFWAVRSAWDALVEILTLGQAMGTPSQRFQVIFTRNAFDRFGVVVLGVLGVLMVVLIEHYYRTGVDQGTLPRRVVLVTLIEVGVLFISLTLQVALAGVMGLFTIWSIAVPLGVLAVAVALSWALTRLPKQAATPT
jgi:hypothetical protein